MLGHAAKKSNSWLKNVSGNTFEKKINIKCLVTLILTLDRNLIIPTLNSC